MDSFLCILCAFVTLWFFGYDYRLIMESLTKRAIIFAVILYLAVIALFFVIDRIESSLSGLQFQVQSAGSIRGQGISRRIALDVLSKVPSPPGENFSVRWNGYWFAPVTRLYAVQAGADDRVELRIDGNLAMLQDTGSEKGIDVQYVPLSPGFHRIEVLYSQVAGAQFLRLQLGHASRVLDLLDPPAVFPQVPSKIRLWSARFFSFTRAILLIWIAVIPLQCIIIFLISPFRKILDPAFAQRTFVRIAKVVIPSLIILYGGLLRFEALTIKHGDVTHPGVVQAMQEHVDGVRNLHPDTLRWTPGSNPYEKGDPINYLRMARAMKSFYAAQFREPFYVFVVKQSLKIFGPEDIAVSFASGFFSVLAIFATFLLGAYTFSWWTGVLASLGMAVDQELVGIGIDGWRDDTFMFLVLLFAYAMVRLFRKASFGNALFAGIIAGIVTLTRMTSFSFIVPAYLYVLLAGKRISWKVQLQYLLLSVFVFAAVIAPFLINCAIVYGDPLFSVNDNTKFYRSRENIPAEQPQTVAEYLSEKLLERPWKFIDTAIVGLTRYPFLNKWKGFIYLSPDLATVLRALAVLGCLMFLFTAEGRLILLLLISLLIPYAFTYQIPGGWEWRFTMPAYPFYMIAAALSLVVCLSVLFKRSSSGLFPERKLSRKSAIQVAVIILLIVISGWLVFNELNFLRKAEAVRAGESIRIDSGDRDFRFLGKGWSSAVQMQDDSVRITRGTDSDLRIPLAGGRDYNIILGMKPAFLNPQTAPAIRVLINGTAATDFTIQPPDTAYKLLLSPDLARDGLNHLTLHNESGAVALSYLKVQPIEAFQRGMEKFRNQEFDAAIPLFEQAIRESKKRNAQPFYYLGECYLKKADGAKAVESFTQALLLSRGNGEIIEARAEAYLLTREYDKAIEDLNKLLSRYPNNAGAKKLLATALQSQKEQ